MKAYQFVSFLACAVLMGGVFCPATIGAETEQTKTAPAPKVVPVTFVGVIEIDDEDDDGNVTQVGIFDGKNNYYVIANDAKGKQLLNQVSAKLQVTGTVKKDANDNDVLTVTAVAPVKAEKKAEPVKKDDVEDDEDENDGDW